MRIAICDDEKEILESLSRQIQAICPRDSIRPYSSGDELMSETEPADIVFLDIQMPGTDGMSVAHELHRRRSDTVIIFVTGSADHVFDAFDAGAFNYLIKPVSHEKLKAVLRRATERLRQGSARKAEKHLVIQSGGIHTTVAVSDIVYAEVFNRKIILHRMDGDIEYYGRLSALQKQVGEGFFRPHRAYLVNLAYVVKYNASAIYLERGQALMAKQNYPAFVREYMEYVRRIGGFE